MSSRYIRAPGSNCPAQEHHLRTMFGITGGKWPAQGCKPREIQGIMVHVLPTDHASLINLATGKKRSRAQHRCIAACPECGAQVSAGRLQQHRCDARVSREEALRRFEFKRTLARTRSQEQLRHLELTYLDAPDDTQDQDDAFNAFCYAAEAAMGPDQRDEWNSWCHKATQDEIVSEALRILDMKATERKPATT
jgi:hypothetical protein